MPEIVVDTNVWVMADQVTSIGAETPHDEADCIGACYAWLLAFIRGDDKLLVDDDYKVMSEYRNNVPRGGLAEQELNRLESQPLERLVNIAIAFDRHGHATLPDHLSVSDASDRKFVALAISTTPYAPIYNATDTDWQKERTQLESQGLTIREICPDYIDARIALE